MVTEMIAIAVGVYALAAGLSVLIDPQRFMAMLDGLRDRAAANYMAGVSIYAIGAAILMFHHRWDGWLEVTVTLIGAAAAIEGLGWLVSPGLFFRFLHTFWKFHTIRYWGALAAGFGLLMIGAGLTKAGVLM
ncbi:MAG TPA: hypothetical protein VGN97_19440 [Mesorhizobium sp.]|jgi:hypothetical protein|nr:hypothetical protein [Mesorhizobium sp.]